MMTAQKERGCTEILAPRIDATARPALATCSFEGRIQFGASMTPKFFKNGWLGAAVESVRLRRSFGGNRSELHKTNNARSPHRTERKRLHKMAPSSLYLAQRESSPGRFASLFFVLCFSCFLHLCCSALDLSAALVID